MVEYRQEMDSQKYDILTSGKYLTTKNILTNNMQNYRIAIIIDC